jgi:hypothetical protein
VAIRSRQREIYPVKKQIKKIAKSALAGLESGVNWALEKSVGRRLMKNHSAKVLSTYAIQASPAHKDSVFSASLSDFVDSDTGYFSHLSLGNIPGNAGDILITHLQKVLWEKAIGQGVNWYDAYPDIKARTQKEFFLHSKCVVIGPGGLVSGAPYSNQSGWFLDFDEGLFQKDDFPVVVFGAGVNQWKNKRPFTDKALANIEKMFNRCSWVGLRETAGINFLSENLGDSVKGKLEFQPCPSLLLSELVSEIPNWDSRFVSVNIAADQLVELPIDRQQVAQIYNRLLNHLVARDLMPIIWCASTVDQDFAHEHFPQHRTLLLSGFPGGQIPHMVRMFRFAIGTRMHSVFPFIGMGIPAIATFGFHIRSSVMRDDLGLGDWLCDWSVEDQDWSKASEELIDKADRMIDQIEQQRIIASQTAQRMSKLTLDNLSRLLERLDLKTVASESLANELH